MGSAFSDRKYINEKDMKQILTVITQQRVPIYFIVCSYYAYKKKNYFLFLDTERERNRAEKNTLWSVFCLLNSLTSYYLVDLQQMLFLTSWDIGLHCHMSLYPNHQLCSTSQESDRYQIATAVLSKQPKANQSITLQLYKHTEEFDLWELEILPGKTKIATSEKEF